MDPLLFFFVALRASALSLGGQTGVPLLRNDLVTTGAMTDFQLVQALTIGRIGTGPGGLYIVAIGYLVLGWPGAVLALIAAILPPLLVLPISSYLRPRLPQPRVNGLMRGLALTSSGLVASTSVQLLSAATPGRPPEIWQFGLIALGIGTGLTGRLHPLLIIGIGALVGLLFGLVIPPVRP
jgi:chromate transporter